jgi:hypothetical protein
MKQKKHIKLFEQFVNEENNSNEEIHNQIVDLLGKLDGITDVKGYFENPNKYGDITSKIYFKFNIVDNYNYSKGEISITYKIKQVFMPDRGYFILDDLTPENVITLAKKEYKL